MRTMSGGPCPHYDCSNKNSFGYCKTTACINTHYQQEQWISTTNKSERVVIKQQTNADRIRAMTDEELAKFLYEYGGSFPNCDRVNLAFDYKSCKDCWLEWLEKEVDG